MNNQLNFQMLGIQREIDDTAIFLGKPENKEKAFNASTEVFHAGTPSRIPFDLGMLILQEGFKNIRDNP